MIIGLDVGGTKIHAAAFEEDHRLVTEVRCPTDTGGGQAVMGSILSTLDQLVHELGGAEVQSIGIGIPGMIDVENGVVHQAVNLGIRDEPIKLAAEVRAHSGIRCAIENDVNAVALGAFTALKPASVGSSLAYLNIGTGIAAGVILNNQIYRGSRGAAGEIGHIPVASGPRCECGLRGCLEAVASGAAISRAWPGRKESAAPGLFAAATKGNPQARQVVEELTHHLAKAVHLLALTFDVEQIVLGGGATDAGQPLLAAIQDSLTKMEETSSFVRSLELPSRVRLAPPGPIGALGAALVAESSDQHSTHHNQ